MLDEIKNQLVLQAKRWGREDYYTSVKLEEMELSQCGKILGDLLSEKANLQYEAQAMDENKKEIGLKLSKLDLYIKKAARVMKKHEKSISKVLSKSIEEEKFGLKPKNKVSVLISDN